MCPEWGTLGLGKKSSQVRCFAWHTTDPSSIPCTPRNPQGVVPEHRVKSKYRSPTLAQKEIGQLKEVEYSQYFREDRGLGW